jgi:hypothetical protein
LCLFEGRAAAAAVDGAAADPAAAADGAVVDSDALDGAATVAGEAPDGLAAGDSSDGLPAAVQLRWRETAQALADVTSQLHRVHPARPLVEQYQPLKHRRDVGGLGPGVSGLSMAPC